MADSAIAPALRAKGATTAAIVGAGMGSAVSQAIQGKWSWREVGASTVAGGAGYYAGKAVGRVMQGLDANAVKIAASTGAAVAGSWASSQVMGYSSAETRARLSQAFISGLGQGIGDALGGSPTNQPGAASERRWLSGTRLSGTGNGLGVANDAVPLGDSNDGPLELAPIRLSDGRYIDGDGAIRSAGSVQVSDALGEVGKFSSAGSRIDSKLSAFTPIGLKKSDGSPITYSFDQITGEAFWDYGSADSVRVIPKAFRQPTLDEAKRLPGNPFGGMDDAAADFLKLGFAGGLGGVGAGAVVRGAVAVQAEIAAFGGLFGGGLKGAILANIAGFSEASVIGVETTLGLATSAAAPSVVLAGAATAKVAGLLDNAAPEARVLGNVGTRVDDFAAPGTNLAPNVRAYPDGSLRTPDGKFASVGGQPAPGTVNASNYADFLRSNGVDVVGTELEVVGPLGVRKYDIGTRNPDGSYSVSKSRAAARNPTRTKTSRTGSSMSSGRREEAGYPARPLRIR